MAFRLHNNNATQQPVKNKKVHDHEIVISGIHMELTDALKSIAREKITKLIRHQERIDRIKLDLEYDAHKSHTNPFIAKAMVSIGGPDLVCSVASDDLHKSLDLLVEKLDRMLQRRARMHKEKRNHPHEIELPALLPKVAGAR
jgi:putative sigma-54 modulation protein